MLESESKGVLEGEAEGVLEGEAEGVLEGETEGVLEGETRGVLEGETQGVLEGYTVGVLEGEDSQSRERPLYLTPPSLSQILPLIFICDQCLTSSHPLLPELRVRCRSESKIESDPHACLRQPSIQGRAFLTQASEGARK